MDQLLPKEIPWGHKVYAPSLAPVPLSGLTSIDLFDRPLYTHADSDTLVKISSATCIGSSHSSKVIDDKDNSKSLVEITLPPPLPLSAATWASTSTLHLIFPEHLPSWVISAHHSHGWSHSLPHIIPAYHLHLSWVSKVCHNPSSPPHYLVVLARSPMGAKWNLPLPLLPVSQMRYLHLWCYRASHHRWLRWMTYLSGHLRTLTQWPVTLLWRTCGGLRQTWMSALFWSLLVESWLCLQVQPTCWGWWRRLVGIHQTQAGIIKYQQDIVDQKSPLCCLNDNSHLVCHQDINWQDYIPLFIIWQWQNHTPIHVPCLFILIETLSWWWCHICHLSSLSRGGIISTHHCCSNSSLDLYMVFHLYMMLYFSCFCILYFNHLVLLLLLLLPLLIFILMIL